MGKRGARGLSLKRNPGLRVSVPGESGGDVASFWGILLPNGSRVRLGVCHSLPNLARSWSMRVVIMIGRRFVGSTALRMRQIYHSEVILSMTVAAGLSALGPYS